MLHDLRKALNNSNLWLFFALEDIKFKYKRSLLGPVWNTIGIIISSSLVAFLWSNIFQKEFFDYFVYILSGFVFWNWFTSSINEAGSIFSEFRRVITVYDIPFFSYILRSSTRNFFFLIHNLIPLILIGLYLNGTSLLLYIPLFILNVFLIFILINFIVFSLAIITTRYKDISSIVSLILQIMFFLTPIIWHKESARAALFLVNFNPLSHLVDLFRLPLMQNIPGFTAYMTLLTILILSIILLQFLHKNYINKVAYWI